VPIEGEKRDDGIVLSNCITESREDSKLRSFKFIQKMVELTVYFLLFVFLFEDSQLQFTKNFVFEEKIDEYVVIFVLESVLYLYYL
jgi:hypothetical protein